MKRLSTSTARRMWRLSLLIGVTAVALALPDAVQAHALLERATPVPDSVVSTAPRHIHIWFSEDLSPASKIIVWDRSRHNETVGSAAIVPGQSRQMEAPLKPLRPGSYLVLWTSVSADDGHILHGSYIFSVKHRGPLPSLTGVSLGSGQQGFPDSSTLVSLLAHWLELWSSVVWVGSIAFAVFVFRSVSSRLKPEAVAAERARRSALVAGSLVVLLLSSAVLIVVQAFGLAGNSWNALASGSVWSSVFAVDYGRLWIARQILIISALLVTASAMVRARSSRLNGIRVSDALVLSIGALYLLLYAASGHAASAAIGTLGSQHLLSLSVLVDWLHFVADALWFGGQVYLILVLIPVLRLRAGLGSLGVFLDALNRFSPFAYLSVGLYVLSGAFSAKVHIPSWYAFFNSVYGRTLIVKMALIGLMMLTSVLTVYFLRPTIRRSSMARGSAVDIELAPRVKGLLRWLQVNPLLGAGVLLATSVMFYYPVPFNFGPPPPAGYVASAQGLTGRITITPNRAGVNRVTIALRDSKGRPVTQAGVRVLSTMLDMVMGTGVGVLQPTQTPGTFAGNTELGMGGHWRLLFLLYMPDGKFVQMSVRVQVGT